MIIYSKNIIEELGKKGYTTYKIKQEKIFNQTQLQQLRDNKLLTQDNLNKLCELLECQPGDILEYRKDNE
jgi:putative transcriptional regulator